MEKTLPLPVIPASATAEQVCQQIFKTRGLAVRLATACGVTRSAVYQWKKVPVEHVDVVAPILGVTREVIRPDIFKPLESNAE